VEFGAVAGWGEERAVLGLEVHCSTAPLHGCLRDNDLGHERKRVAEDPLQDNPQEIFLEVKFSRTL